VDTSSLGLWFVCGLGAAIFSAAGPASGRAALAGAAGFAIGVWWLSQPFAPTATLVGCLVAVTAAFCLLRRLRPLYAMGLAGLLAGVWVGPLEAEGVPLVVAALFAAAVPVASARLRGSGRAFAPPALRDEALLFAVMLGLVVAAMPTVIDGWHAAANLKLQGTDAAGAAGAGMPLWTSTISCAALVGGGLYSLWSRR
jgi:hypothetical protein